jgi:TonB family protein
MTFITPYLLKVSLGLAIVTVPYFLLLRNDPNLVLKRFYLLLGILAAWIFPLLAFRKPELLSGFTPTVFIDPGEQIPFLPATGGAVSAPGSDLLQLPWPVLIYLAGLFFLLIRNLVLLFRWNHIWRMNRDQTGVAYTGHSQVFTLFSRIFIPMELKGRPDLDNILLHEQAHKEQLHFIDLTIMELTLLLTWFNPFSWLISRMIKENHEHLADRQVLSAGVNSARYRAQLLNHTLGVNIFRLGNPFNHSLTFKRFNMMKKPEKSLSGTIKLALLIPAILLVLGFATGAEPGRTGTIKGKIVLADSGEPAPGASVIIANSTMGTVSDIDGNFVLNVEGDPEIVISFVGYETIRIRSSEIGKKPLELKEKDYTLDLGENPGNHISFRASEAALFKDETGEDPVIVLNGEVVLTYDNVDPEDIDHVEVIKDPDSKIAKKYNAEHGVILITTREDKPKVMVPDEEVFIVVEDMPMFPGGREALKDYIYSRLQYPAELEDENISGEVMVRFTVTGKGNLENLTVVSSSRKEFEKRALEVFRDMPAWNPGMQRGKAVRVNVLMPIRFKPAVL